MNFVCCSYFKLKLYDNQWLQIVKDWNSELQEQTNKFRKQAAAMADWDRRILQNRSVLIRLEVGVYNILLLILFVFIIFF